MHDRLIHLANHVYENIGPGFSERVYHNAFEVILRKNMIPYETERIIPIVFEEHTIGTIRADLIVNTEVIVELNAVNTINTSMLIQAENYIRLTGIPIALLINFPPVHCLECEVSVVPSGKSTADIL